MSRDLLEELEAELEQRRADGLFRSPRSSYGTSFTSNDYLGLASDPELASVVAHGVENSGTGLTGSRLLSGEGPLPRVAESFLAAFCGQSAAVLFSSGYAANVGLMSAIARRGDHVVSDALNHASLIDGIRLSGAHKHIVPHGDLMAMERALAGLPAEGRRFVVVESIYSMDGDLTDLAVICTLAERYGAAVIVDEAHATGLYGQRGSGRVEALGLTDRVLCTVHTGGKALGSGGAWVAGSKTLARYLHNHARSFIYSTAPVPGLILSLIAAVRMLPSLADRVAAVHRKARVLRQGLVAAGFDTGPSASCIVPVMMGDSDEAMAVARELTRAGFDVRAIRPPTVPQGTARLRLTVTSDLPDSEIARLLSVLADTQAAA